MAGIAVIEHGEPEGVLIGHLVDTEGRVLREGPVEVRVVAHIFIAVEFLAVLINRGEKQIMVGLLPAGAAAQNPLHLVIAADLDDRALVTGRNDDGVVRRVIVDRVHVSPVAARASADDVAKVSCFIELLQFLGSNRLAGEARVNIQADSALIECLDGDIAIRIKNFPETPLINHLTILVHFNNQVADRVHVAAIGTLQVGRCHTKEVVTVLGSVH